MSKYICNACGYIYDPNIGDKTQNVKEGTLFEELPTEWVCPVCGVGKEDFRKED